MRVIGMISGTSIDAIEVAAGDYRLHEGDIHLRLLGSISVPYDPALRSAIAAILPPAPTTAEVICRLDTLIGQAFAGAAERANEELCGGTADVVVSHGQTIYHWVEAGRALGTLQLGQPAWIAERTGLPVVSDLRPRDVAAGGQGAPLASTFDALLLGHDRAITRGLLNLGGISNMTVLPVDGEPSAFDIGTANALMDAVVQHRSGGRTAFDEGGRRAARGSVHQGLLDRLLAEPYYRRRPPKSTGKELFSLAYVEAAVAGAAPGIAEDDLVATLCALAARTIARACAENGVAELVAAGGGTKNPTLMAMLRRELPSVPVRTTAEWGIPVDAKEAHVFGLLGFLTLHGLPAATPSCTGARHASILGRITPGRGPLVLPPPAALTPTRLVVDR